MKKINVLFAITAVFVLLGSFFSCQVDTAERIHVTFTDPKGGNPDRTVDIVKGDALGGNMYTPSRAGPYVFYGWFEGSSQYYPDTPISVDLTLTARWADDIVTVKFAFTEEDSAHNVIQPTATIPDIVAIKGEPLGPLEFPPTPRSEGWKFDSWRLDDAEFTAGTPLPSDASEVTLTAHWVVPTKYTATFKYFKTDPSSKWIVIQVNAGECIDEWRVRFPESPTQSSENPLAFFVAWFDDENRAYDGRVPITRNVTITAKWGLPPYHVKLRMVADGGDISALDASPISETNGVDYAPVVKEAWDSTAENPKWVIVNTTTYDVPNNTNRWRILYRISFQWPDGFNTGFYTSYTIRARFYANRQGAATWAQDPAYAEGQFVPNGVPIEQLPTAPGYSAAGWLRKKDYLVPDEEGNPKEISRSDDGWGQVSWTSVANFNGQGAHEETMLQRYNLDRKQGTINDTWAPLRNADINPPYLLIQTSDAYIGHIEVTDIIFHNGEKKFTMYVDEEGYDEADDGSETE